MNSFKMKIFLSIVGALIFSLLFVLLALVLPLKQEEKPKIITEKQYKSRVQAADLAKELKKH
jgi:hypothetical protein